MSYLVKFTIEEQDDGTFSFLATGEDGEIVGRVDDFLTQEEAKRAGEDMLAMMRSVNQ